MPLGVSCLYEAADAGANDQVGHLLQVHAYDGEQFYGADTFDDEQTIDGSRRQGLRAHRHGRAGCGRAVRESAARRSRSATRPSTSVSPMRTGSMPPITETMWSHWRGAPPTACNRRQEPEESQWPSRSRSIVSSCMGSGNCSFWAPGVFDLDDDGIAIVLDPTAQPEDKIVLAAQGCPTQAIAIRATANDRVIRAIGAAESDAASGSCEHAGHADRDHRRARGAAPGGSAVRRDAASRPRCRAPRSTPSTTTGPSSGPRSREPGWLGLHVAEALRRRRATARRAGGRARGARPRPPRPGRTCRRCSPPRSCRTPAARRPTSCCRSSRRGAADRRGRADRRRSRCSAGCSPTSIVCEVDGAWVRARSRPRDGRPSARAST